jgi:hypothetical protein
MNKAVLPMGVIALAALQSGCAQQSFDALRENITVQPRVNGGTQYYQYTQEEQPQISPTQFSAGSKSFSVTSSKLTISDVMPLINGGITIFKEKVFNDNDGFFLDFDTQYAFNGSSSSSYSNRANLPQNDPVLSPRLPFLKTSSAVVDSSSSSESQFDRTEYSITFGYQYNEHLLLYAGYKRAFTDFAQDNMAGSVRGINPATGQVIGATTGSFGGPTQVCLDYDGAFIGAKTAWHLASGPLDGLLTGHFGVAFLEGTQTLTGTITIHRTDGTSGQLPTDVYGLRTNQSGFRGSSIGWVLGMGWRGATPYRDLTYSAGVNAYQYNFDGKTASDISEMAVRFDMGLAYSFEI